MNKRIALSALSILTTLALTGGAAFAFFSDVGTSTGNTFSAGTLNLKLTDSNETALDNVTASFGGTNMGPGSCTGNQTLALQNSGTVAGDHAEVTVTNNVTDSGLPATPDMDAYLRLNVLTYGGTDVTGQITDANTNGYKDLADWAAGTGLDNLALTDLNTDHPLVMDVCLDGSGPNELQSDSVVSDFTVTLNQSNLQ